MLRPNVSTVSLNFDAVLRTHLNGVNAKNCISEKITLQGWGNQYILFHHRRKMYRDRKY